jgi:hypothetical protein
VPTVEIAKELLDLTFSSVACNVVAKNRFGNYKSCHLHATGSKHRQLF